MNFMRGKAGVLVHEHFGRHERVQPHNRHSKSQSNTQKVHTARE